MEIVKWLGLLPVVLICSWFHLRLLPQHIQAGNLILTLSKPVGDIGKLYSKSRQACLALIHILEPKMNL